MLILQPPGGVGEKYIDTPRLGGGVGMGLRESDGELRGKFDAAITSMKEDGSLNKLLVKSFGEGQALY